MLDDHEEFIDEVINEVLRKNKIKKNQEDRRKTEAATIESLMEITDLSRAEIEKVLKKRRKEKLAEQEGIDEIKNQPNIFTQLLTKYKILSIALAIPLLIFILFFSINILNSNTQSETILNSTTQPDIHVRNNESNHEPVKRGVDYAHKELIQAIRDGNDGTVKYLLSKGTPLYLPGNTSLNSDPFYMAVKHSDLSMLKTLLALGLEPLNNMKSFNEVASIINRREKESLNAVIFSHLVELDSTPNEIKLLWEFKIPYSYYGVQKALKSNNLDAIRLVHKANKGKYTQNWLAVSLLNELINSNFYNTEVTKILNKLLFDGTLPKQETTALASDAALIALQYDQYQIAEYYITKGANPTQSLTNTDFDRYKFDDFNNSDRLLFGYAVIRGQVNMVKKFLEEGYQISTQSSDFFMFYALSGLLTDHDNAPLKGDTLLRKQLEIFKIMDEYGFKFKGKHLLYFSQKVRFLTNPIGDYNYNPVPYKEVAEYLVKHTGSFPMDRKLLILFTKLGIESSARVMVKAGIVPSDDLIYTAIVYNHLELATFMIESKISKGYTDLWGWLQTNHQINFSNSLMYENKFISTEQRHERLIFFRKHNLIDESNPEIKSNIERFYSN